MIKPRLRWDYEFKAWVTNYGQDDLEDSLRRALREALVGRIQPLYDGYPQRQSNSWGKEPDSLNRSFGFNL